MNSPVPPVITNTKMNLFLREAKSTAITWYPVAVRGSLWVLIAVLTDLSHCLHDITPEKLLAMSWVDYVEIPVSAVLSGAIALRLFLDQSISNAKRDRDHPETR